MIDDINVAELERLLFSERKRPSEMTTNDFRALSGVMDALIERYGEDRIARMLKELGQMESGRIFVRKPAIRPDNRFDIHP